MWEVSHNDHEEHLIKICVLLQILSDGSNNGSVVVPCGELSFDSSMINLFKNTAPCQQIPKCLSGEATLLGLPIYHVF